MRAASDALIDGFCRLVGLDDAEYVRNGGAIEVEGVVSSILYNEQANDELLFLYVDFGPPPAQQEATVYSELLKRNFMKFAGKGPAFTISPITGHVVHVEHFRIDETTPEILAQAVTDLAHEANDWRKTRFLSGPYALSLAADHNTDPFDASIAA